MRLVELHDINNPQRIIALDADDFSAAIPYGSGSAIMLKSNSQPIAVHESTTEVEEVIYG